MEPYQFVPRELGEWLRLIIGALLFLAPGLAAAERFLSPWPARFFLAPVLSFSLLATTALVLEFLFAAPLNAAMTHGIAVAWTVVLLQPQIRPLLVSWGILSPAREERLW